MCEKRGKIVLLPLCIAFILFTVKTSARSITEKEKTRLRDSMEHRSSAPLTIDASFTKKAITMPEAAKRKKEERLERTKKLREETNSDTISYGSFEIAMPDGSEIRLSETRLRIGTGLRLRDDTTIFANTEKTETLSETTIINTGYEKDSKRYEIDHKWKDLSIWTGRKWGGRQILRFGKVDENIVTDILSFYFDRSLGSRSKNKSFLHNSTAVVDGNAVDEIECINSENNKPVYKISLDSDDWQICRKIVWYDEKTGLVSEIVEYKEFSKAKGSGELFPHLVIRRYFDEVGEEEKVETINVTNVTLGLSIPDEVFKVDVPEEYSIIDYTNL